MRIGLSTIPRMRVPALLKGQMILFDLASLQGQWSIICRLPPFEFGEAIVLNQFQRTVQKEGAMLLGLLPFGDLALDSRLPKAKILRIPLLADPLQRLRRVFGLTGTPFNNRCQSYVIDPQGVIRYHLVHQLNWRGLSFLIEILNYCQDQHSSSPTFPICLPPGTNLPRSPQLQRSGNLATLARTSLLDHKGELYYATDPTP
jgi:hypothetical protein